MIENAHGLDGIGNHDLRIADLDQIVAVAFFAASRKI